MSKTKTISEKSMDNTLEKNKNMKDKINNKDNPKNNENTNKKNLKVKPNISALNLLTFFVPFIVLFIGFILGGFKPFGTKDILTASGHENLIPYIYELWDNLHYGTIFSYSTKTGIGYNILSIFTYYFSDPLNMIIFLLPRGAVISAVNVIYIFKCSLSGVFFSIYLSHRNRLFIKQTRDTEAQNNNDITICSKKITLDQIINLVLSTAYALSAYMISYGMNITWLSSVVIFPIIIMGLEKIYAERKPLLYIVTLGFSFISSIQISFIILVFSFFYFISLSFKNVRHILASFLYKLISDALAFGLAFIFVYPNIKNSLFSKEYSLYFPIHNLYTGTLNALRSLLNVPTSNNIYQINLYCGIFSIFLFICYLQIKSSTEWQKIRTTALFLLLIISGFMSTPNFLMNGMNLNLTSTSVFSFTLIFTALIICNEVLNNINQINLKNIGISSILSLLFTIVILLFSEDYSSISPFIVAIEFIVFLSLGAIVSLKYDFKEKPANDDVTENNSNDDTNEDKSETIKENISEENIREQKSKDTRHIIYLDTQNRSLIMGTILSLIIFIEVVFSSISGVSKLGQNSPEYSQTETAKIDIAVSYILSIEPSARILNYKAYHTDSTPVTNLVLGYDYILFPANSDCADTTLEYVGNVNDIDIYYNPYAIHTGIYSNANIIDWEGNGEYPFTGINLLLRESLSGEDVFKSADGSFNTVKGNTDSRATILMYSFPEDGDYYVNMSQIIHLGEMKADEPKYINYISNYADTQNEFIAGEFTSFDKDAFIRSINKIITGETPVDITNNKINISINAPDNGYIILPYDISECFDSSAECSSIEFFSDNITLVKVAKGNNNLTLEYNGTKALLIGGIISFVAIIWIVLFVLLSAKLESIPVQENVKYNRFERFISSNKVYIYTIIILICIYIVITMVNRCIPFGARSVLVSDGYIENYPTTMHMIHKIKALDFSVLDFTIGFFGGGISYATLQYFIVPTRLVLLLFPESMDLFAFNFLYAVEFVLTGISVLIYLTKRPDFKENNVIKKNSLKLIPMALCYSLSSFVLCYYHYNGFLELAMIFPLILLAMEKMIYEKNYIFYTIILSYFMIISTYFAFLLCEFLFLYFFTLDFKDIKDFFNKGIRFALSSIVAALMAVFTLLPFFISTQNTTYSARDTEAATKMNYFSFSILSSIRDFEVMHRLSLTNSDFTVANTYCGLLLLLALSIYVMIKKIKPSVRIRKILLIVLLYVSYGNEYLNFVFHGFHKQSEVPNRFSIFFILLLIQIFYEIIINYKNIFTKRILTSFSIFSLVIATIIIYNNWNTAYFDKHFVASIIFIIAYLLVFIIGYLKKNHYKSTKGLIYLLCFELIISCFFTMSYTFGYKSTSEKSIKIMRNLSDKYNLKEGITRSEILDLKSVNLSCMINTNSASIFSSTISSQQMLLSKEWNGNAGINIINYYMGNPLANIMLNEKYFFKDMYTVEMPAPIYMTKKEEISNISLYEDSYTSDFGLCIPSSLSMKDRLDYENGFEYQNTFVNNLTGSDLYTIIDMTTDVDKLDEDHSYILMSEIDEERLCTLQINPAKDISGDLYIFFDNSISYLGEDKAGENNSYEVDVHLKTYEAENLHKYFKVAVLNKEAHEKISSFFKEHKLSNLSINNNTISGTYNESSSSTIFYALPASDAWVAYIDGNKSKTKYFMGGIGVDVPAGEHEIKLVYETSSDPFPYILSLIFITLFIAFIIYKNYKTKHLNNSLFSNKKENNDIIPDESKESK